MKNTNIYPLFLLILIGFLSTYANAADTDEIQPSDTALVMFLTNTDPMIAGHGVHFASRMAMEDRSVTIILVGEAGRLGLKAWSSNVSNVENIPLHEVLQDVIKHGGKVLMTPYTLMSFNANAEDLIQGVSLPKDPISMHNHMFAANTKLLVW
ncbi:MAG: hypothetical protein AAGJ37_04210 [Pseudomonadota bacterium]